MADNFLDSACYVLGIKDNRRPSDLLIWLTMTGQLGRWPTAGGAELSAAVHGPGAVHPWPTDPNRWRS
jgi:hypothetical protein